MPNSMRENQQLLIEIQRNVSQALAEDVGTGDLTALLISPGRAAPGLVTAREEAVLCGRDWFEACLRALDPKATVAWHVAEGEWVAPDQKLCEILSETRALLTAERAALNFLQLLSATATKLQARF